MGDNVLTYPKNGTLYVNLDGEEVMVARIILTTWQPNAPGNNNGKGVVCWKNGNRMDNCCSNLFWLPTGPGWD